jgi:hypothetical protein
MNLSESLLDYWDLKCVYIQYKSEALHVKQGRLNAELRGINSCYRKDGNEDKCDSKWKGRKLSSP